ncbi:PREDICTED: lebercilin-like protein [Thamnophis sirtalis]|uniref:Lebercilin-like protein n=1 Tax=Thamnophis sirtalis TaxID=35019 RepID=A0A6I9XP49_9SAUR|nr:PREDICTED: lebercilin-like protein [Thamnophis sirtalis]
MMWLLTSSQTSWNVKSNGPYEQQSNNKASGGDSIPAELFKILKDDASLNVFNNIHMTSKRKNKTACRLLSARDHKIKQLKSEAALLQNKLKTFTTENNILKRLQSRHLKAIKKYEHAEINLPDLLATQSTEARTLRAHLKLSQEEERRASKKLRDVHAELLKTTDALRVLQKLFESKKLEEREELHQKLTAFTQKLEASEKKTQDLEKQLSLNTASFRHQLAVEKKKIIEAQSITANLRVEIQSLKQKLKERDREVGIRNIYAHRMPKGHPEKADSCSSPKVVKVNKAIQVNISLKATSLRKPEPDVSPMTFHEELKTNMEVKELVTMAKTLAPETGIHLSEKLPVDSISNRTFMGLQSEDIWVEKNIQYENIERYKNRRERQGLDLLKAEAKELKTEPVEKQENKEDKEAKEAVCDILTPGIERHRTPSTSKKQYVFSEAIQNLHQGYPSTGPRITCSRRPWNRQQSEIADFIGDSVNNYEPSFAKFPKEKQKDTPSTPTEENCPKILPEKKRLLLEKLFGPNRILSSSDPNSNLSMAGNEKKTLCRVKKPYEEA